MVPLRRLPLVALCLAVTTLSLRAQEGFKFKSGVELVNVTATVTGRDGRFMSGLSKDDFTVYDDNRLQEITHFSNDRVPISLGIILDCSGSMADQKMQSARAAINRFVTDLLDEDDQLFFMHFNERNVLDQDWTHDRHAITRAVNRVQAVGATAMYDAIAAALPIAAAGEHPKKALLVISDGNDSDSLIDVGGLRQLIRQSEVLVYALGIDGAERSSSSPRSQPAPRQPQPPVTIPFPGGGGRPRGRFLPLLLPQFGGWSIGGNSDRVNASALRQLTDDTGGRTEIIREIKDLDGATARIADELSKQYSLGYSSPGLRDGQWHSIRVEVKDRSATVRARKGYVSS